jgi:hypothetical protein
VWLRAVEEFLGEESGVVVGQRCRQEDDAVHDGRQDAVNHVCAVSCDVAAALAASRAASSTSSSSSYSTRRTSAPINTAAASRTGPDCSSTPSKPFSRCGQANASVSKPGRS